jgi:hypothetical protein
MQETALIRMHAKYDKMPRADKQKSLLHIQDPETMDSIILTPDDQIYEVTHLTEIGKKLIVASLQHISSLQP